MINLFITSLVFLFMIWIFYPVILKVLCMFFQDDVYGNETDYKIDVSVIIAAHNEADNLKKRCENIFSQNYNGDVEVIIASDGSNDNTSSVVSELKDQFDNIVFIDLQPQGGRSNAHNIAVQQSNNEILIFTDAETVFENDCISKLVRPFASTKIGFVSGSLKYFNLNLNSISKSVGMYWNFEMFLRKAESTLGLYATGTGACCAVRKSLYNIIPPTGDVDFITPIDVVLAGKKCIHSSDAIAWDQLPVSPKKELAARVRMTSKNIHGTISRWGLLAIFKKPIYTLTIFLHKIGRWLTPFALIVVFFSNLFLLGDGWLFYVIFMAQILFYSLGILGYLGVNIIYSPQVYSFILANVGFFLGVLKAIFGKIPYAYKPIGRL
jgi:cellulose synthase/poly-beta-1,6-N-acetylglucosamine synthase-like glycosyltransferase